MTNKNRKKWEKVGETDKKIIYNVTTYKKDGEFDTIVKIPKQFTFSLQAKTIKEFIRDLLPELYDIRANTTLTWGQVTREKMGKLIDKLERRVK